MNFSFTNTTIVVNKYVQGYRATHDFRVSANLTEKQASFQHRHLDCANDLTRLHDCKICSTA